MRWSRPSRLWLLWHQPRQAVPSGLLGHSPPPAPALATAPQPQPPPFPFPSAADPLPPAAPLCQVPEWTEYYVNYSLLKGIIDNIRKGETSEAAPLPVAHDEEEPLLPHGGPQAWSPWPPPAPKAPASPCCWGASCSAGAHGPEAHGADAHPRRCRRPSPPGLTLHAALAGCKQHIWRRARPTPGQQAARPYRLAHLSPPALLQAGRPLAPSRSS
jgi:hypothetical protein